MKLLHCADLHLGRSFHERSLADDQAAVLRDLAGLAASGGYAALVIAGDVYDRALPSPDAVNLLGDFLADLRARCPSLAVLMIPGNHDSADRLGYASPLFARLGIHIVADAEAAFEPVLVEADGEACAFFLLPFLAPGSLRAEDGTCPRSQRDLAALAARRLDEALPAARGRAAAAVLVAHLFAVGGAPSESERVFLGTAEQVDAGLFDGFDYVALGHLHACQRVGKKAWYPGSPLAYAFDEVAMSKDAGASLDAGAAPGAGKCFLSVGVGRDAAPDGSPSVERIPVRPPRAVARLRGPFASFLEPGAHGGLKEAYLEISLSDSGLVENALALLRGRFPHLLSVRQDEALSALAAASPAGSGADRRRGPRSGAADDFGAFLSELYGPSGPDSEEGKAEIELYRALEKEAADAAP